MNCSEINSLLDRLMDDELSDDMRSELEAHAAVCPKCSENISATIEMKKMLEGMDAEADVPLAAQAAWRKAVKQEAARIKRRRLYRSVGAVAAAVAVFVGVSLAVGFSDMKPDTSADNMVRSAVVYEAEPAADIAVIESDGSAAAVSRAIPGPAEGDILAEFDFTVENIESASGYISDLVVEYDGSVDIGNSEDSRLSLRISMPADNVNDFLDASCHLDISGAEHTFADEVDSGSVSFLIVLRT